jgi:uncharacterized protein (DUF1778 family)
MGKFLMFPANCRAFPNVRRIPMSNARKTTGASQKRERLVARVTLEQKRLIARAANLGGTSVTDFLLLSAQQAANETIQDFELLRLQDEARNVFVSAILNPPAPKKAARLAAARYKGNMDR